MLTALLHMYSTSVRRAIHSWKNDPALMIANIIASFLVGQSIYWKWGSDQFGLFMNPLKTLGLGPKVGIWVYERIPHTPEIAWAIKVIEIITDFIRGPVEGVVYLRHGITPDFVATAVTQPAWSAIEAGEKTLGAALHPERVTQDTQVVQSIANVYGNIFRYGHALVLLAAGGLIVRYLSRPIAKVIQRAIPAWH